jgi:two-component system nitrogen regulation sensor histidine kinase NtrY
VAENRRRRIGVGWLAGGLGMLLLVFASLNAFNLPFLLPHSTGQLFFFTGLSVLVFLLLVGLLVLLFRNILRLYADERSRVLGSRIRTRMLLGALLLSFAPAFFLFLFSYLLMNRTVDRWFSQPVSELRTESSRVAVQLTQYVAGNARAEAASLAASPAVQQDLAKNDFASMHDRIAEHRITLEGGFVLVYRGQHPVATFQTPPATQDVQVRTWTSDDRGTTTLSNSASDTAGATPAASHSLEELALVTSRRSDEPVLAVGDSEYATAAAPVAGDFTIVVGLPLPAGFSKTVFGLRRGALDYFALYRARNRVRGLYLLIIFVLTVLVFFTSSWLALFLSKRITRPVEALADAMDAIAAGEYSHRIPLGTAHEMGDLVTAFNAMAADLETSRGVAESSTAQLSDANRALQERRRELETILQTIPTGVITLNDELRVVQSNRAIAQILSLVSPADGEEAPLESLFPPEQREDLWRMIRRCQRVGIAQGEFEFRRNSSPNGHGIQLEAVHMSVTVALLELEQRRRGYIMVLEDVTESLRAQRQVAWKEAAQRVAHEIKNPLTPIALSAGRIQRHLERNTPESPADIRRCSEVILSSVEAMRGLVDHFAALAQFPIPQIRPVDLNHVARAAIDSFAGRLDRIQLIEHLAPEPVMIAGDATVLTRAMVNLIDNAAEAMQQSLLREMTIETCILGCSNGSSNDGSMAEIVISDTGPGLTADARERLFLPYFSTKQRGTGLGLAITAKIVQEHGGFIRAEQNTPSGARFIIELPLAEKSGASNGHAVNGHAALDTGTPETAHASVPAITTTPARVPA